MFRNLSLRGFTFPKEPAVYVALAVAVGNVVVSALNGELGSDEAIQSIVALLAGFVTRSRVSPA